MTRGPIEAFRPWADFDRLSVPGGIPAPISNEVWRSQVRINSGPWEATHV